MSIASSPTDSATPAELSPLRISAIWARHLMCFVLPVTSLAFSLSGPHVWYLALPWLLPLAASLIADFRSPAERRQPHPHLPRWPFDAVLYVLVVMQFANVVLLARMIGQSGFFTMDLVVGMLLVGINSGYSAIVVGHELIHRKEKYMQLLGRALMGTVLYEHFYTEHIRGHHSRVGTDEDPATARFGESFRAFWRRTVRDQFRSAWRLEAKRLGDENMKWNDRRILRSRVLHGLIAEWSFALVLFAAFGPAAFLVFVLQALNAIRALEAVNYFEHWGLRRTGRKVRPVDSWDTESAFTLYTLVGLSRHADHHAYASRPYHQLRHWQESPKLPAGYFGMVWMVEIRNRRFQQLMTAELQRRRLGPFAEAA